MPELPEVETVKRGLEPVSTGARIFEARTNRPDLRFPFPPRLRERLEGRTITLLGRRAKYLLFHLDDGSSLLSHLGMSGSWRIERPDESDLPGRFHHARGKSAAHDHFELLLAGKQGDVRLVYNDPRRFGFIDLIEAGQAETHPAFAKLGPEPTGNHLNGGFLQAAFAGKRTPLKAALLDQSVVAGLGNIYVCEALWRAGLSPRRISSTLSRNSKAARDNADRLALSIRAVIDDAIAAGGSSLRDHRQADGSLGYFQHSFNAYDREGAECRREGCGGVMRRIVQSGRSTFYCDSCQK